MFAQELGGREAQVSGQARDVNERQLHVTLVTPATSPALLAPEATRRVHAFNHGGGAIKGRGFNGFKCPSPI
ncbi:MAG: hypothetical protein Kow0069_11510 [Promethearchaeota archaeon]